MEILIHLLEFQVIGLQLQLSAVVGFNITLTLLIPLLWRLCQRDAGANVKYDMCEAHKVLDIN